MLDDKFKQDSKKDDCEFSCVYCMLRVLQIYKKNWRKTLALNLT